MLRSIGVVLALLLGATQVLAHAHLRQASPAASATVKAPAEVVLSFTEDLEVQFSSIEVRDAQGTRLDEARAEAVPGDRRALRVKLRAAAPGRYTVDWAATSVDTHRVTGSYSFTVRP